MKSDTGVLIPVDKTKKRIDQIQKVVEIMGKQVILTAVSPLRRYQPTISWDYLMEKIALAPVD